MKEPIIIGNFYKVRKDLIPDTSYYGLYFADEMEKFLGKKIKFDHLDELGRGVTKDGWVFNKTMLQSVIPKSNKTKYTSSDRDSALEWWTKMNGEERTIKLIELYNSYLTKITKQSQKESKKIKYPILDEPLQESIRIWIKEITDKLNSLN